VTADSSRSLLLESFADFKNLAGHPGQENRPTNGTVMPIQPSIARAPYIHVSSGRWFPGGNDGRAPTAFGIHALEFACGLTRSGDAGAGHVAAPVSQIAQL